MDKPTNKTPPCITRAQVKAIAGVIVGWQRVINNTRTTRGRIVITYFTPHLSSLCSTSLRVCPVNITHQLQNICHKMQSVVGSVVGQFYLIFISTICSPSPHQFNNITKIFTNMVSLLLNNPTTPLSNNNITITGNLTMPHCPAWGRAIIIITAII